MSDTASGSEPIEPIPASQNPPDPEKPEGSGSTSVGTHSVQPDDGDATIISRRPIPSPAPLSDWAYRILQGRLRPGDKLGHFELVEYIGGGGMGRVFRAIDTSLARSVALKVLAQDHTADEEALLRFRNEAQSAARLDHENIARVHYVGEDHGLHYIVFEFIEGVNVRTLVRQKGPLALSEAVSYTLQVAEALVHASRRDVVHRDIKPSNVLITPDGRVKLIDMGLARLRKLNTSNEDLTASGVTLGTFDYISPEQARDPRLADVRSDIYSLGCTLYYVLASRPPFPEGTVLQKLLQHQGDRAPRIQEIRPELPDDVDRILAKMLAKDPRDRYQEPERLVHDLLILGEQVGLHPSANRGQYRFGRILSGLYNSLPWVVPIVALICIVTALHFLWSSEVDPPLPSAPARGTLTTTPPLLASSADKRNDSRNDVDSPDASPGPPASKQPSDNPTAPPSATEPAGASPVAHDPDGLQPEAPTTLPEEDAVAHAHVDPSDGGTPPAAPAHKGILVVGEPALGGKAYPSLSSACDAAVNGDVIELRYDGPRVEKPVQFANLKVIVRAGDGYRPTIVFRPDEADPIKHPRRMFSLAGGRLTFVNVAMEFDVPQEIPADDWALIETQGNQTVRLDGCTLTIRNAAKDNSASHPEVAFFLTKAAPGAELASDGNGAKETPVTSITLTDCVIRGEADVLCCRDLQPIHLSWNNGLLATTERLLLLSGGQKTPPYSDLVDVNLWHLTAVMQQGMCRFVTSAIRPHPIPVKINCVDSILVTNSNAALIEYVGDGKDTDLREWFDWYGGRNFYEDFRIFSSVYGIDHQPLATMDFDEWTNYWPENENQPSLHTIAWRALPTADREVHTHTPLDYALDETAGSDFGVGAASEGGDVGCVIGRLPHIPRPVEKPVTSPETPTTPSTPPAPRPSTIPAGPAAE